MTREALAPAIEASARHMAQHLVREALAETRALLAKVGRLCCRTLSAYACSCPHVRAVAFVSTHSKFTSDCCFLTLSVCMISCSHLHTPEVNYLKKIFYFVCVHAAAFISTRWKFTFILYALISIHYKFTSFFCVHVPTVALICIH